MFRNLSITERKLYEAIEQGQNVPVGSSDYNIKNAFTRLRRNGLIKNIGSRTRPVWIIVNLVDRDLTLDESQKLQRAMARLEKAVRTAKDAQKEIDNILHK